MTTDTIKQLGAEFHHAADGVGEALRRLERARGDRLAFLRRCSTDSTARLAALKEEIRTLPEQIAKWDAEAARLESQTAEDLLRQALEPAPREPSPNRFDCESCGTGVSADEDGCCATCGQTCWQWVNGECVLAGGAEPEEVPTEPAQEQPKPEPFRAGLPPERLRKVWAEWEDEDGNVFIFKGATYRLPEWKLSCSDREIGDVLDWKSYRFRPHGATWARVEAMADETEKPKCPACGKQPDRDALPLSPGEHVRCQSCQLILRVVDGAWQIAPGFSVPARVVKEGGEDAHE